MSRIRRLLERHLKIYPKVPKNANFKKGFLFIHIPKNAGSSLGNILGINLPSHLYLRDFQNRILPEHFAALKVIAVVRNPWERFLSLYNYARMDVSYYHNNIDPENSQFGIHEDYQVLKDASLIECAHLLTQGALKHSHPNTQWNPQSEWLKNNDGELATAHFLGRLETLNDTISDLEDLIGPLPPLQHVNRSTEQDYHDLLDLETKKIITAYYEEDIDNFKYTY